jgi:putative transcriptional regulator
MKNKLRILPSGRDWSQANLAARINVSRQTMNAIETGWYDPNLELAFRLACLFDLRIEEIFEPDKAS